MKVITNESSSSGISKSLYDWLLTGKSPKDVDMADEDTSPWNRLWHLQERLKQERLFVNKEKAEITNLNQEIQSSCQRLYHLSWITRQQWKIVQRVRASPEECSQAVNRLDSARFVDASRHLGYLESKYWEFLKGIRENPSLVASTLAYADKINLDTSQLIRLLLNSLYGNCLLPLDESYVLLLMKHLIELKITGDENPEQFFQHRRNSFTSLFGILVESLFAAKLYLTAALHAPIMQVLAEDSMLKKRLPFICTKFVESLKAKLYCFPQSLRWLVWQFSKILSASGRVNDKDVRWMVLKLLFDCLVCPAIIRPEQFGITSDVQISEIALQNLQQIASCLLNCCSSEGDRENPRTVDMFSRIDPNCVTSYLDALLESQKEVADLPNQMSLPGLCRNSVLITENELHAFTSFLRMVEHSEDHRDIVNHQELKELLDSLPPQPNPPEPPTPELPKDVHPPSNESPTDSPKTPKKRRPFKGKKEEKPRKHSLGEAQASEVEEAKVIKQFNPLAVVSKSEEFKKEFLRRIPLILQEDEDVLVISLGYSVIECPGLLSEEKVLGIEKPKKEEDLNKSFRPRSSSSQFYKHIFPEKPAARNANGDPSNDRISDEKITSYTENDNDQTNASGILQPTIPNPRPADYSAKQPESTNEVLSGTDHVDLLHSSPERNVHAAPDVIERKNTEVEHSGSVDLIDFRSGGESPPPLPPAPVDTSSNQVVERQSPIGFDDQAPGNRDSAISSSSSVRINSFSSASTRSSGVEFTKECIFVDSGHGDIAEEESGLDFSGLEHLAAPAPGDDFRKRTSVINDQEKRHSKISHRGSTSSGTITGFQGEGSNRDSQASFLSFDAEFPHRSGSSSTADDEHEAPPREKKASRADSLKQRFRSRKKTKGKGSFDGEENLNKEKGEKKEKGLFKMIRTGRSKDTTKASGSRVYEKLAESTLDTFDINSRMAHPEVEEKTPKEIENVINKYETMAQRAAEESKMDVAVADDDDDEPDEEDNDIVDEDERFENSKRKLRLVLCQADFQNLPLLHPDNRLPEKRVKKPGHELLTFLHVQLAEAINLQDRSLSAQLHETIRSVKDLQPQSFAKLLESLEKEYKVRTPYLAYLVNAHQGLLATHAHLERLVERVERYIGAVSLFRSPSFNRSPMKMSVQSKSSRKHVPVIDISPLLKDGNSSSIYVSDVVKRIDQALRNEGLFYISGHGVPQTVTDDFMEAEKRFFEMPLEKKMAISVRNSKGYRGYVQKGSEKTSGKVDVKEGIYFGPDASPDEPDVNSGKSLVGPNQFPDERDLPNFANKVKQYMDHLKTVGLSLMRAIAMGLQLKRDHFDDMFSNPSAWLALWSYPANPRKDSSWGIWPHTDPEMMTIILQDDVGGLEVQVPDSGEWIAVPPIPGTFVVNVGDPLEAWTKGLYRAGVHRVRSSPGKHRFSATFFYGPSYKSIIEPLDIDLTRNIDYSPEIRRRKLPCTYGDYYIKSFENSLDWFK